MRRPAASDGATTADVQHALARPGCAVCHLTHRTVTRFMKALSYEQVNDLELRELLRASRGFCPPHAQRWLHMTGNVLGTAIIYTDAITAALRALDSPPGRSMLSALRSSRAHESPACVACTAEQDAADRFVDALVDALGDASVSAALAASDGLCLPHTRRAAERAGRRADPIVARAREHGQRLLAELAEVIRKEDYRFQHEPKSDTDRTAPRRAVSWTAGLDNPS
jgi:hypothetical protein